MLLPRVEFFQRQESCHYYFDDEDNFAGTWETFYFGQRGYIYSLLVTRGNFFRFLRKNFQLLFRHGVKYLYFDMMEDTLKVLERMTSEKVDYVHEGSFEKNGRKFIMVRVSERESI